MKNPEYMKSSLRCTDYSLICPNDSLIRKQGKTVKIRIRILTCGKILYLFLLTNITKLDVFIEYKCKIQRHNADKRRVQRKLHIKSR